ncbi:MAG: hypothetical protein LBF49_03080 [Puniceicoccales bacterium]|jgi:hypothetical protein|nr:hypothetical protein [Puniceicoccales bacterium]
MDMNTSVIASAIPNDDHVKNLRSDGFEVDVFRGTEKKGEKMAERRIVVIRSLYGFPSYYAYDSVLEDYGLCPIKTLTEREVKDLRNDPSLIHKRPQEQFS